MSGSLTVSFLGALQASLSVLLTIGVGVVASQFSILNQGTTKQLSTLCIRVFLPCLLISNLGSNLSPESSVRYAPVLIWALTYTFSSMLLGVVLTRIFKLPSWITPALAFNNTTSLPLLLIQSLESTGILEVLLVSDTDTTADALNRAKSYFLVCAIVSNSLTFSLGPRLLDSEEAPDTDSSHRTEGKNQPQVEGSSEDTSQSSRSSQPNGHANGEAQESTSLLPDYVVRHGGEAGETAHHRSKQVWDRLSPKTQSLLDLLFAFLNAPLLGAVMGGIIGLTPPLHRAFFNDPEEGGIFKAWLTASIQNVGDIFAALQVGLSDTTFLDQSHQSQVVVVGVKLSACLRKMKRGEQSGRVPWLPSTIVLVMRFAVWPCISIAAIYLISSRTQLIPFDPVLIFAMMLMPTGPPAMAISSLADCNDSSDEEKMAISKFLIITASPQ
ncbi:MAG: hypothetical protein Q9170_001731 [Blastenia crenularia]